MEVRHYVASGRQERIRTGVGFETVERTAHGPQPVARETVSHSVDGPLNTRRPDARTPAAAPDPPAPGSLPGSLAGPLPDPNQNPIQDPIQGPPAGPDPAPRRALAWVAVALSLHLFLDRVLGGPSSGAFRGLWTPDPSAGLVQGWLWTVLDHPFRSALGLTAVSWALRPWSGSLSGGGVPQEATGGQMSARKENAARL